MWDGATFPINSDTRLVIDERPTETTDRRQTAHDLDVFEDGIRRADQDSRQRPRDLPEGGRRGSECGERVSRDFFMARTKVRVNRDAVVAMAREGFTARQITEALGCSKTAVGNVLLENGLSRKLKGAPERKPWREFQCAWCGKSNKTKRDNKIYCGRSCCSKALMQARWHYPGRPELNKAVLQRLYWDEGKTSIEIAAILEMSHKGVLDAMRRFEVRRRRLGPRSKGTCCEQDCNLPIHRILHKTNGSWYGRRCRLHWIIFRMEVNQRYADKKFGKDEAWLRRMRQLLARVQRLNREVSRSLNQESLRATTSPAA